MPDLTNLTLLQYFAIGCFLAFLVHITFFRKRFFREIRKIWDENQAKNAKIRQNISNYKATGKFPRESSTIRWQADNLGLQIIQSKILDRWVGGAYLKWHNLSPKLRLFLCWPVCVALVFAVFFTLFPIFLAAQSYPILISATYLMKFISIFAVYLFIFLIMTRYRFIISWFFALNFLLFEIIIANNPLQTGSFWEVTYRGFYHFVAVILITWIWVRSNQNRPGALLRLLGMILLIIGIANAALSFFIAGNALDRTNQINAEQTLAAPIYKSFEPLLKQVMTPLHFQIGDFVPETIVLAILLLTWGGLLFCLGTLMMCTEYENIAKVPEEVEGLKLYT